MIGLTHYLTVAAILFTIGIFGIFLNRKNVIDIIMTMTFLRLRNIPKMPIVKRMAATVR